MTPGWALILVLVIAFTYLCLSVLAPWQLGKNERREEFNARLSAAAEKDPVDVATVLPADGSSAGPDKEWTRVRLRGTFLPDKQVLLRNRPVDSAPAFQVLTPMRTDSGQTVLVNRGWVYTPDGATIPSIPAPPSGPTEVTGYVQLSDPPPSSPDTEVGPHRLVNSISTAHIGRTEGLPLATEYVQLDDASARALDAAAKERRGETPQPGDTPALAALPLPRLEPGPFLSYGIQWVAFGILAPLGLGWFIHAEVRERKREREELAALGQPESQGASSAAADPRAAAPAAPAAPGPATPGSLDAGAAVDAAPASGAGSDAGDRPGVPNRTSPRSDATAHATARSVAQRYGTRKRSRFAKPRPDEDGERF